MTVCEIVNRLAESRSNLQDYGVRTGKKLRSGTFVPFCHVLSKSILLSCFVSVCGAFALSSSIQKMGQPSVGKLFGEGMGMPTASSGSVSMVRTGIRIGGLKRGDSDLNEIADLRFLTT